MIEGENCENCKSFRSLPFVEGNLEIDGLCLNSEDEDYPATTMKEDWCNKYEAI